MRPFGLLWVPGEIPGLNEILNAAGVISKVAGRGGKRWNAYSDMKRSWGHKIALQARAQGFEPIIGGATFHFSFYESDRRRDPPNFIGGGLKLIPDALQESGLLPNDGWKDFLGCSFEWFVLADRGPGVLLRVERESVECQKSDQSQEPWASYLRRSAS